MHPNGRENVSSAHWPQPRHPGRRLTAGVLAGLVGLLSTGLVGTSADAAETTVESSYVSINAERVGENGLRVVAVDLNDYPARPDAQLRIATTSVQTIPSNADYAWLGAAGTPRWETANSTSAGLPGEARMLLSTGDVTGTRTEDPSVHFSIANPVAPGSFSIYSPPDQSPDTGLPVVRWGTGKQRDGSPQNLDQEVALPPERYQIPIRAAFEAPGLYCFDITTRATFASGPPASATRTIRVAVGDEVAADAPCGTSTDEQPLAVPAAPQYPLATVEGTTVDVSWRAPAWGDVSGSTVTLTNHINDPLVRTADGPSTTARFENVPPGRYTATVVATNQHGNSPTSDPSNGVVILAPADQTLVVASGHIDGIAPRVDTDEDGAQSLALRAHHDDYGWLDWDRMVLYSNDSSKQVLPETYSSGADFSFVADPGSEVWVSPQRQRPGLPWVGLSTEDDGLASSVPSDDTVGIRIEGVSGPGGTPAPGDFAIEQGGSGYGTATNGVGLVGGTREGLPRGFRTGTYNHQHYSWYFTEPGVYCLAVVVDANLSDGKRHMARGLLTHVVGETVDPSTVEPCETTTEYPSTSTPSSITATDADPFQFADGFGNISLVTGDGGAEVSLLHSESRRNALPERHDLDNVLFRGSANNSAAGANDGRYYFGKPEDPYAARDSKPHLSWNTFGVHQENTVGDITWSVDAVRGPGEFGVEDQSWSPKAVLDTARDLTTARIWARSETRQLGWYVTKPGKYCVDLTWSTRTTSDTDLSVTKTVTIVADGAGFEHSAETLTATCADGGEPTDPGDPGPDPEPGAQPWDVPNWSRTTSGATILNRGHVDIASTVEDGRLNTLIKDTTAEGAENAGPGGGYVSWHEPEDVVFQLLPSAQRQVPDREPFRFLGKPGSPIWLTPETQDPAILWPGWSTEHIASGTLEGGVDWTLTGMEGPGDLFLYTTDPDDRERPLVHIDTSNGISETDTVPIGARVHVHGTWAFTQPGVYCLDMKRSATLSSGSTPTSNSFTLAVVIGEADPKPVDPHNCVGSPAPDPEPVAPDAPAAPTVSVDGSAVTASWAESADDGGSPITGYTVNLSPADGSTSRSALTREIVGDTTSVVISDVPAGSWRATVAATNAAGSSPASPASVPFTVTAPNPDREPVTTTVSAVATTQTYGKAARLVLSVSPNATGQVEVRAGTRTLTGTLSNGTASVRLPARALVPGRQALRLSYAGVAGKFKPATGAATVRVVKATARVRVERIMTRAQRGRLVAFKVLVTAAGATPGGKVTVRVGGKTQTAELNSRGKATVGIRLSRTAKRGPRTVTVSYLGDRYVSTGAGRTRIRVT